ncbi:hypothetical protein PR202_gb05204 [Eleusine coracana subsp. coracana]|uniref:RING-type E3 ubiquitin transferase n=1 Tax=Eleusine coracana subsp. coracana TaxID=191504 RepID=A0AAV5E6K8_ELECO|nr:hypothetical protein QOZ80_1BG0078730 [Eleusine coracana subsp. coracana]GJN18083.1 hypothetical protein PR202_gb05204 [Eleusine coracana subsp. coracana]
MAPPPSNPHRHTRQLCFVLPILLLSSVAADSTPSYSSHCPSPAPSPDLVHTNVNDTIALLEHFRFSPGFFSGSGASNLFMPGVSGQFSFFPHAVSRTADPALLHLSSARLTLFGERAGAQNGTLGFGSYERIYDVAISFRLDGYYSTTTSELCMVGTGTDTDGPAKRYADVDLRLRVPSKPSLVDPFVAGRLEGGADFEAVNLVAYADGDVYEYSEGRATCPAEAAATTSARRALEPQQPGGGFSCAAIRSRLVSEYRLRHAQSNSSSLPKLHEPAMMVNQVRCAANGAVRLYAVFSNDVRLWASANRFAVENQGVVAEGFWDAETRRLCLRACRVELLVSYWSSAAEKLEVRECGIGMSFWFPAVWTVRDRSATAAMLWNASGDAGVISNPITASTFQYIIRTTTTTTNLSDVKYSYTQTFLDTATRHYYLNARRSMSNANKKTEASFPGTYNFSSYRDLEFRFLADNEEMVRGQAYPVSIGSAMVDGDELAAEYAFSRHAAPEMKQSRLVNISYGILFQFTAFDRPDCSEIKAEGVYDTETGFVSMLGCRELNVSTDCKVLITVQFSSLEESQASGHGKGRISSLRDKTDVLYFESRNITLYGMYSEQVSESIWRMDMERIITLASSTLSCAFAILQILHIKRNRDAARATSITMLVVLALGHAIPLVLDLHTLLANRSRLFVELSGNGLLELHELVLRVPALIAFLLQLRLLQLAWSGRRSSGHHRSLDAERRVLLVCLPLYLIGVAVSGVIHAENSRATRKDPLLVDFPGTLWGALASYAGLVTDGFLLPQVVLNAFSSESSSARALSPWFYVGGTVIRVAPHVYDVFRARRYVPSAKTSYVYANPRDGLFRSAAWDVVVTCGAAALAFLLLLQQRLGSDVRRTSHIWLASSSS